MASVRAGFIVNNKKIYFDVDENLLQLLYSGKTITQLLVTLYFTYNKIQFRIKTNYYYLIKS